MSISQTVSSKFGSKMAPFGQENHCLPRDSPQDLTYVQSWGCIFPHEVGIYVSVAPDLLLWLQHGPEKRNFKFKIGFFSMKVPGAGLWWLYTTRQCRQHCGFSVVLEKHEVFSQCQKPFCCCLDLGEKLTPPEMICTTSWSIFRCSFCGEPFGYFIKAHFFIEWNPCPTALHAGLKVYMEWGWSQAPPCRPRRYGWPSGILYKSWWLPI